MIEGSMVRGSTPIFIWRISGAGIVFVTHVMLARWMGAAELGVYVLTFSWFLLLATLAGAGLRQAAIRFVGYGLANEDYGYIQRFVNTSTGVVLVVSLVIAAIGVLVVSVGGGVGPDALTKPFLIAMLAIPLYAVMSFHLGVANACAWFSLSFFPNMFLRPLLFLMALIVASVLAPRLTATLAMGLHGLVITAVAIIAIYVVRSRLALHRFGPASQTELRLWIRTGVPLLIITLFSAYSLELNLILLGAFLPSSDIAIFNACYRLALLLAFGLFAVDAYISPQIATLNARDDRQNLQRVITHATLLRVGGAVAATVLFAVFGKSLLGLFGAEFVGGYSALMMLTFGQVVHAASGPSTKLLSIGGHQDQCLYVFAVSFALLAGLTALLAPAYGIFGAAVAAFCGVALWSVWLAVLVTRHMQIRPTILSAYTPAHR